MGWIWDKRVVAVPATTRFCWTYVAQMTLLQPSVGLPDFWAGPGFEDKLLRAQGDFSLNAGQHSVTYLPNDEMEAEKYIYRVYKYKL